MDQAKYYMNLKADTSGSRTKNRFRLELLWGISKILELMETTDNFTMVFDYVCDIEVHKDDSFEFYQIKTHKSEKRYTPNSLVKYKKDSEEGSILGKLFALNLGDEDGVKLFLVCNEPFKALSSDPGELSFNKLVKLEREKIIKSLKSELEIDSVDLSKAFYLYTPMNLLNPVDQIKGELITIFEKIKGSEPINPNALYNLVFDMVSEKACYEFTLNDYDKLKALKGITRSEFDRLLDVHCSNEKTGITATKEYINSILNIKEKKIYNKALSTFVPKLAKSRDMQALELKMADFLDGEDDIGDMSNAIDLLSGVFYDSFPIEYDNAEKTVCFMIVINKYIEGGYEK